MGGDSSKPWESVPTGSVVKYIIGAEILGARHWGIYIGDGLVVSKYDDGHIKCEHIGNKPWIGFKVKHICSNTKVAREALRRWEQKIPEYYNLQTDNCQHWVAKVYSSVGEYCPDPKEVSDVSIFFKNRVNKLSRDSNNNATPEAEKVLKKGLEILKKSS